MALESRTICDLCAQGSLGVTVGNVTVKGVTYEVDICEDCRKRVTTRGRRQGPLPRRPRRSLQQQAEESLRGKPRPE